MPSTQSGVTLCKVTRLSGSGRSSVVSHHGTAWCFIPSITKPGVSGGASPFIISEVEAADRLHLPQRKGVIGVGSLR
jgi:hypothetical protein